MRPVFIASLGNPGSEYAHTLHSAGHTLLAALVAHVGLSPLAVNMNKTGNRGRSTFSDSQGIAFWESPTYMNDSGPSLHSAWKRWSNSAAVKRFDALTVAGNVGGEGRRVPLELLPRLIVLHDELELPIGKYSVKTTLGASARGHNGLKSLLNAPAMNAVRFTRIGVGIGPRPASREPDVVAKYVLGKMTRMQRVTVEVIAERVWIEIEGIRQGKDEMGGGKKKVSKPVGKWLKSKRLDLSSGDESTDVDSVEDGSVKDGGQQPSGDPPQHTINTG